MKTIGKISVITLLIIFSAGIVNAADFKVNPAASLVKWNGKKVTGEHYGTISVKSGTLQSDAAGLTGGQVDIDMTSIVNEDLKDAGINAKLVGHLKSDDFFSVEKFPLASLKLTGVKKLSGNDHELTGNLTIKGITHPITFTATVGQEGKALVASGKMTINRAKYEVRYGSGSFFQGLGDKMIYDDFTLDFRLVTE
ncbi:MAG TPA: YceI family protein [Prolixibacteraceae bacterium]|nr:YceI family protein [Prolixibacteraceae bacterium]